MHLIVHNLDDLNHILEKEQKPHFLTFHGHILDKDESRLVEFLQQCSFLEYLSVSHQNLQHLIDLGFLKAIDQMKNLKHLNISKNLLSESALNSLIHNLYHKEQSLLSLSLNHPLVPEGFQDPFAHLEGQFFCKNLSISHYPLCLTGSSSIQVDRVHLGSQFFKGYDLDSKTAQLTKKFFIKHLQCSGSDFSHGHQFYDSDLWLSLESLIARMIQMPLSLASQWMTVLSRAQLVSLCLSNNYWLSCKDVLTHFQIKNFISLDLSFCRFEWPVLKDFLKQQPPYLIELSLQGNVLLNQNIDDLFTCLSSHSFLHILNLSDIPLSENHVESLMDFLESHSVGSLELRGSGISLESAYKLIDFFTHSVTLFSLDIEENALPAYCMISLWEIQKNKISDLESYCIAYKNQGWRSLSTEPGIQKILHSLLFSVDADIERVYPFSLRYRYLDDLVRQKKDYPYQGVYRYLQHLEERVSLSRAQKFGFQAFIKNP